MASDFNQTPQSNRLHISLFGRRNAGKSSLLNALTGQDVAVVSDVAGTTTDPVAKAMEIFPVGPVLITDTAGFDDMGQVGDKRVEATKKVVLHTDVALLLSDPDDMEEELRWAELFDTRGIPYIVVLNKIDARPDREAALQRVEQAMKRKPVGVSATTGEGIDALRRRIADIALELEEEEVSPFDSLPISATDVVVLVMPQDIQAPKGRLILPQVQTIRQLLDRRCIVISCTTAEFEATLNALKALPGMVITDSQVFEQVEKLTPKGTPLTSFSILMAAEKSDIRPLVDGAKAIDTLTEHSKVLIAEACTHVPLAEDIGRIQIPRLLRKHAGEGLRVDIASGKDFPDDLSQYDLIVHCGGCMFNRKFMNNRLAQAQAAKVPMTNYGVAIAHLKGILKKVAIPE